MSSCQARAGIEQPLLLHLVPTHFLKSDLLFMYVCSCLHVCLCTTCVPGTRKPEKGVESPGPQLRKAVGVHVGKEIKPGSSEKPTSAFNA